MTKINTTLKNFNSLSAEQKDSVMAAVEILLENNAALPDQLTRLAEIKKTKPFVWTMALKKLGAE